MVKTDRKVALCIFDCSDEFLRKELRRGKFKGVKIGKSAVRIYRDSLDAYLKAGRILTDEATEAPGPENRYV